MLMLIIIFSTTSYGKFIYFQLKTKLLTEHNFFVNITDVLKCSVVEDDMKITDELSCPTTVDKCAMKCSNWKKV